ncbi:MAG: hypothetical protein P4L90_22085 [Rhodopila sp.]|nr:hypothetical protein [Rhodopila sp.]
MKVLPLEATDTSAKHGSVIDAHAASLSRRLLVQALPILAVAGLAAWHLDMMSVASDEVPAAEVEARRARWRTLGPISMRLVGDAEREAAIQALGLPPVAEQQLIADVAQGRIRLGWISLYDSDTEDGDVVDIVSMGLRHTMTLTKTPVAVAIPIPADGKMRLVATDEGRGGGVTVGILTHRGPWALPPMRVGDAILVTVVGQ